MEYVLEVERDYVIRIWIEELDRIIDLIRRRAIDKLISYLDPERQRALRDF